MKKIIVYVLFFGMAPAFGQVLYAPSPVGTSTNTNVGIGTTSTPTGAKLYVNTTNNSDYSGIFYNGGQDGGVLRAITASTLGAQTTFEVLRGTTTSSLIVKGGGAVGINKSNPAYWLDVNGSFNATSYYLNGVAITPGASQWTTSAPNIYYNTGIVSVGTATPYSQARLHIKAANTSAWGYVAEANGNDKILGIGHDGTNAVISASYLSAGGYSPIKFRTSNLDRLTIDVGGNVGIGTAAPAVPLHVSGTTYLGTTGNETYFTSGATFVSTKAGIRNNGGDVVFNSRTGGSLYFNRDVSSDVMIQSVEGGLTVDIATFLHTGNVGIGTAVPDAKLAVKGTVHCKEVKVDLAGAMVPDYVFENDYELPSIDGLKIYIEQNKHLPEVPSAKEIEKNGVQLGEMNMILLKKVEELTLYQIQTNERIKKLEDEIARLRTNEK